MKRIKLPASYLLVTAALGGSLAFSGCSMNDQQPAQQDAPGLSNQQVVEQEEPEKEPEVQAITYDFAGINLDIPEYWKADSEVSETGSSLVFRSEDQRSTLLVTRGTIPQFMTVKAQGDTIVEATEEEIAENYIGISVMSDEQEQTIGDIEAVNSGDSSYYRQTFRGTANFVSTGEIKAAQRNALILLNDGSEYLQISVYCPEEEDGYLADADSLMASIIGQL